MRWFIILILLISQTMVAQPKTDELLRSLLLNDTASLLHKVVSDPDQYRVQIIYTQIDRAKNNKPSFRNYYFNYDPDLYFNPASMVKLPLAALALQKVATLKKKGINKFTSLQMDSTYPGQVAATADTTSQSGLPSLAHYIRRAFLISENDPYNRLYQFVGQQTINRKLHEMGYSKSRIIRQFMGFSEDQNRHTNGVRFVGTNGSTLYYQPPAYNKDSLVVPHPIKLGRGYMDRNDSLIAQPFDFTMHNNLPLEDLQQLMQSIIFPNSVSKKQRFHFSEEDGRFLLQYLSQYPSQTPYPFYDTSLFYDSYVKFFFRDSTKQMPQHIRVFNKVGWSYGFLTDVSYVVDFESGIEYMLAATLYVNSDGILNDGKYDYDNIGYPFLHQLGQVIYQHELMRKRKTKPNLKALQISYEYRNPLDKRTPIKEVDN